MFILKQILLTQNRNTMVAQTMPEILAEIARMSKDFNADETFWRMLMDNPDTLRLTIAKAIEIQGSKLNTSDGAQALTWIASIEDAEKPFTDRNYYCMTSTSQHDSLWREEARNNISSICEKASHNADTKEFLLLLKYYFELSYVYSGIYAEIHEKRPHDIIHEYYFAMTETFERELGDSTNPHVIALSEQWEIIKEKTPQKFSGVWVP